MMDRVLFGDNQFFGVNHMSEEKARAQAIRFQDLDNVMSVLHSAHDNGFRTFMCTTHERVADILDRMRREQPAWSGQQFYPCMPYAHKYANAMTDFGMVGAIKRFLPDEGLFDAALRGGRSLATKDLEGVITLLVDAEMKAFDGFETPVVFLQNVAVDMMIGLGFTDALGIFANHVRRRYDAEPGFITMNLPQCLDALDAAGVDNPIVCSNINKVGFRMSGGEQAYRNALTERRFRGVAMSVFASGAIPAREALEWIRDVPNIESIVFGASSETNIRSTRRLVDELWNDEPALMPPVRLEASALRDAT